LPLTRQHTDSIAFKPHNKAQQLHKHSINLPSSTKPHHSLETCLQVAAEEIPTIATKPVEAEAAKAKAKVKNEHTKQTKTDNKKKTSSPTSTSQTTPKSANSKKLDNTTSNAERSNKLAHQTCAEYIPINTPKPTTHIGAKAAIWKADEQATVRGSP
jgi:hypothetical protein